MTSEGQSLATKEENGLDQVAEELTIFLYVLHPPFL